MADITIYGPRPYFAAKLKKAVADDTVVEAITAAGGTLTIPAGTIQEVLQALADAINPA